MGASNQPISTDNNRQNQTEQSQSKHPRFLNAEIDKSKDGSLYYEVTKSIGNIFTYNNWETILTELKKKIGPNSLFLPYECEYQQQGFCGTGGVLKFRFEYFGFLLDEQILNRQSQNLPFQEKQIWFLLYILVQTAASLHKLGHLVGDIKPKNIFINHTGDIAIYNMFSFPEEFTNFQKVRFFKEFNYLPPQGINDIQTGKQTPTYDQMIGQSFSIGLTILDAIFLTEHSFLYDRMERFNEIVFLKIIQTLQNSQLSENLKRIVSLMVSMNPEKRLNCIELCQYLQPYEKQIFELEDFQIKSGPIRYQQQPKVELSGKSTDEFQTNSKKQNVSRLTSFQSANQQYFTQSSGMKINQKSTQKQINTQNQTKNKQLSLDKNTVHTRSKNQFRNIQLKEAQPQMFSGEKKSEVLTFKTGNLFQKQRNSMTHLQDVGSFYQPVSPNQSVTNQQPTYKTSYQKYETYESNVRPYVEVNAFEGGSGTSYTDFLKSIQKQIQQSRKMFPNSMK